MRIKIKDLGKKKKKKKLKEDCFFFVDGDQMTGRSEHHKHLDELEQLEGKF